MDPHELKRRRADLISLSGEGWARSQRKPYQKPPAEIRLGSGKAIVPNGTRRWLYSGSIKALMDETPVANAAAIHRVCTRAGRCDLPLRHPSRGVMVR